VDSTRGVHTLDFETKGLTHPQLDNPKARAMRAFVLRAPGNAPALTHGAGSISSGSPRLDHAHAFTVTLFG